MSRRVSPPTLDGGHVRACQARSVGDGLPRLRYNQLVADLVILHNVEQMTRVLAELREDGAHISAEVLAGLSPYRTSHIKPVR
ncbi:transposase [Xanthomonas hortorum pv. pelargonii]|nr:transposase [Xanthomonas hortorum pv. pelargonii]